MTPNQIADLISEQFAIDRARLTVRLCVVSWEAPGGIRLEVDAWSSVWRASGPTYIRVGTPGGFAAVITIPKERHDLIPWAVEHVSTIALQARAHGVP